MGWSFVSRALGFAVVLGVGAGCAEATEEAVARDAGKDTRSDTTTPVDTAIDDTGAVDTGPDAPADTGCKPPTGKVCSIYPQCGCDPGKACTIADTTGKTSCRAAGPKGVNEDCTLDSACKAGLTCYLGICQAYCAKDEDCPTAGSSCLAQQYLPTGSTTPTEIPGKLLCHQKCNPLDPAPVCGSNTNCLVLLGRTLCSWASTNTGVGGCKSGNLLCAPGWSCVSTGDCMKNCRVGFAGDCTGTKTCVKFTDPPIVDGIEYGVCNPP